MRVEKDGTKTYSDRPIPGGHPVDLQPAQTYSAPSPPPAGEGRPLEQKLLAQMDSFHYANCAVTPKSEATFTNPQSVDVALVLDPPLRVGDVVELLVDGAPPPAGANTTTSLTMQQPIRGAHTVAASVKDRYGKMLCTASSTFHVFRPSLNAPARQGPRPTPH